MKRLSLAGLLAGASVALCLLLVTFPLAGPARATHPAVTIQTLSASKPDNSHTISATWTFGGDTATYDRIEMYVRPYGGGSITASAILCNTKPCAITSGSVNSSSFLAATNYEVIIYLRSDLGGTLHNAAAGPIGPIKTCTGTGTECGSWPTAQPSPTPTPPAAPTITGVAVTETTATPTWTTPADSTTYKVWAKRSSESEWGTAVELAHPNNTHTFSGLEAGRNYDFRAAACNVAGCTNSDVVQATTTAGSGGGWSANDSDNLAALAETAKQTRFNVTTAAAFALFSLAGLLVFSFWRAVK